MFFNAGRINVCGKIFFRHRGELDLDRRLMAGPEPAELPFFNVRRHVHRLDIRELGNVESLAPVKKLSGRSIVRSAGVRIANVGGSTKMTGPYSVPRVAPMVSRGGLSNQ